MQAERPRKRASFMIEAAAEDDDAMGTYLEGELSEAEITPAMRRARCRPIVPVFCGSAFKNKGVQAMLDAWSINLLPSPVDVPAGEGRRRDEDDKEIPAKANDNAPFSALAFKIMTDPFVGSLTFFRVYSGAELRRPPTTRSRTKKERIGRILQMHSNQREEIKEVRAGDIAARWA